MKIRVLITKLLISEYNINQDEAYKLFFCRL
jgi:hypothetical protein